MVIDPLSAATRAAKRNLLVSSILVLTYRAFDISVEKIPFAGMSITFDPGVFAFLLSLAIIYFGVTFALYYYIDIRNIEETTHQKETKRNTSILIDAYTDRIAEALTLELAAGLPENHRISNVMGQVKRIVVFFGVRRFTDAILFRDEFDPAWIPLSYSTQTPNLSTSTDLTPASHPELFDQLALTVKRRLRFFWWKEKAHRLWRKRLDWGVSAAYTVRNYFTDGILPIALGSLALAALYGWVDVHWIRSVAPTK